MGHVANTGFPGDEVAPEQAREAVRRAVAAAGRADLVRSVVVAQAVHRLGNAEWSVRAIASELGLSKSSVDRILRAGPMGWALRSGEADEIQEAVRAAWAPLHRYTSETPTPENHTIESNDERR